MATATLAPHKSTELPTAKGRFLPDGRLTSLKQIKFLKT